MIIIYSVIEKYITTCLYSTTRVPSGPCTPTKQYNNTSFLCSTQVPSRDEAPNFDRRYDRVLATLSWLMTLGSCCKVPLRLYSPSYGSTAQTGTWPALWGFVTITFLRWIVSPAPSPQPGGPGLRIYDPRRQGDPDIPPGTGYPF
jgi:hypothetical protein